MAENRASEYLIRDELAAFRRRAGMRHLVKNAPILAYEEVPASNAATAKAPPKPRRSERRN